jgi:hypothetical protein
MYTLRKENRSYIYILTMEMKFYFLDFLIIKNSEKSILESIFQVIRVREMCQSCQTWPAQFGQVLLRTDTRLVFCNRKLMRTDIFFTRTTKPICNFANSVVLMFNININYTTLGWITPYPRVHQWTPIVIRGKSRWTHKSDRGNWFVVSSYKPRCPWWTAKKKPKHYV